MTTISSNTLFHFTNSANNIIRIIKYGFEPRFCLEEFGPEFIIWKTIGDEISIPMTCFCDLPLSKIAEHLEFYGSYGIGLSKEWGQQKGLSPLTYVHENSTQLSYMRQVGVSIFNIFNKIDIEKTTMSDNPIVALFELSAFYKPYTGKMWRINKYVDKRFYDECEWRYVPFLNSDKNVYRLSKDEFLNDIKREYENEFIAKKFALKFLYSDIKYLIVKKEEEMIALSDALDNMTDIFDATGIKVLKTKIISSEQIKEDF